MIDINIKTRTVEVPTEITIDGKDYPITQWNIDRVRLYWSDGNKSHLEELKDFALDLS